MIFIGKEQEGKYKGLKTLFIGEQISFTEINKILDKRDDILQIYLGAGRSYELNITKETLNKLLNLNKYIITYETNKNPNLPPDFLSKIHIIYTINENSFSLDLSWLLNNHSIKIEDKEKVLVFPYYSAKINSLEKLKENKYYDGDVILKK